jgi:hypothetical protein
MGSEHDTARGLLGLGLLIGLGFVVGCGATETDDATQVGARLATTSDELVLEELLETFAARPLSREELTQVTREFYGDGGTPTPEERPALDESLQRFRGATERLRRDDASGRALFLRHELVQGAIFGGELKGPVTLAILQEPDPVLVIDARAQYVMTRLDVLAFVNITNFARGTAAPAKPNHRDLTDEQLALVAAELERCFGAQPATENYLPQFYSEAAAYWAGVRREWASLSSQERDLTWLYPSYTFQVNMTDEVFAKVWGLDPTEAALRHLDDTLARTWAVVLLSGEISMYVWFMGDVSRTFTNFWLAMGSW